MSHKKFSVIIPTYNRHAQLASCLDSLAKQNVPNNSFEVIVVDDGSHPKLDPDTYRSRGEFDLRIIYQENRGPAEARNVGARHATGEYLLFTDDDCEPNLDWAQRIVEQLNQTPNKTVGGKTINALHNNPFAEASQLLNSYLYSYYNRNGEKPRFFASNNLGVGKKNFFEIGGFSTNFISHHSEDRDFCDKWIYSGRSMKYCPDALVMHSHHMGFIPFFHQHFNYGKGARMYHLERKLREQPVPGIEPASFYANMIVFPFRRKKIIRGAVLSLLIGITQVAHTFGYFWQRFAIGTD